MTERRHWSTTARVALFHKYGGICHICEGKIWPGEAWDVSHEIPLELGGADDDENAKPAHRKCHRALTATQDVPNIARAKRREAKHIGAKPKGRSFQTNKDGPFKQTFSHGTVRRAP